MDFIYESMGTNWKISFFDESQDDLIYQLKNEILNETNEFDELYSRFKSTSLVSKISTEANKYKVPTDFIEMLNLYFELYIPSQNKLNPLIGNTLSDLGYDANYSLIPKENIRSTPNLIEAVNIISDTEIETFEPVLFDFGALGKGFFIDKIVKKLNDYNLKNYLVNGSGDIYYKGVGEDIRIGLEHPNDSTKIIGILNIKEGSVCGSAINRRRWRNLNHVIDPYKSNSQEEIIATWVWAKSAKVADALASALFFSAPENFMNFEFEYCILNRELKIKKSLGFRADFFN